MIARRFVLALILCCAALAPAAAQERILTFISDVAVERNGDLDVTETIRVQAEGNEIRRGILRDFPTTYTRQDGTRVVVGFDVQSVTRDGAPETFTTEGMANGVRVRIGSADRTLSNGPHDYVIRYRTTRQLGFYSSFDELYWNVTGNGWTLPIDMAEGRVTLPERVAFEQVAFYTGPQGATGKDATVVSREPGHIVIRTTKPLPPHNGLTIAVAWPKGVVAPPSGTEKAGWWLHDNAALVIALIGLPVLLAFYAFAWLRVGRDPPAGTIIPLFGPPEGMSPAAVRYVDRFGFDDRCFTAAIINLGVAGHLKIVGSAKRPILEQQTGGKPVTPGEAAAKEKLFGGQSALALEQSNYKILGGAKTALRKSLESAYLGTLFRNNYAWSWGGLLLLMLLVVALSIAFSVGYPSDASPLLITGILLPVLFIMGGGAMIANGWTGLTRRWGLVIGGVVLIVVSVLVGLVITVAGAPTPLELVPALVTYILSGVAGAAFRLLKAPTVPGRQIMDKIEGFRQYLGVAEESRLEALNPPDKTPELFEKFLPYAVALDVQNSWAKRFASVLAMAGAAAAVNRWYYTDQNWSDDPVGFADHLGTSLNQTISAASTAPGSSDSGSGGGGSSGGGGGGGGGSGW